MVIKMEYVIIILIVINLIVTVISLTKNINETHISERLSKLENTTIKELNSFRTDLTKDMNDDFTKLSDRIEERLRFINDKVNSRLDENFEKTNKTFTSVLEKLAKIDEAQKKIDMLSTDIISLQGILTDKKARGTFGEVNLKHIMNSVFGNDMHLYEMQHKFETGEIADCVLFAPEPLGTVAIDSKFPLENYQRMVDKNLNQGIRDAAEKSFVQDVKKHIDDISRKYIIAGVTSDQAFMFLPAEAVFAEIQAYHQELIDYAYKKKVWLVSPTTLISTLTTIQIIVKNVERDKYASIIHEQLKLLDVEFKRYKERWDKLSNHIETINNDVKDLHTTSEKISKRFDSINKVEIKEIEVDHDGR